MTEIILSIIPILISIPAFLVAIKSLNGYKEIKCRCKECENYKEYNNTNNYEDINELLYSMKFNTDIDDKIRPMLNKYPNSKIIEVVSELICKKWSISSNDIDKVNSHIRDLLLNYNNHYEENPSIDVKNIMETPEDQDIQTNKTIDIKNIFSDFYKD